MSADERILSKIHKLLRMAADAGSVNEAMIATKQARALMDRHQITDADLEAVRDDTFAITDGELVTRKAATWVRVIAASVAELNDCESVLSRYAGFASYSFRGLRTDAVLAKYVHDYLVETCKHMLKASGITGRSNRNFYRLGFAQQIAERITEIVDSRKEIKHSDGRSLVVCKAQLVCEHFERLKPSAPPKLRRPDEDEAAAAYRGSADARTVAINPQIEE